MLTSDSALDRWLDALFEQSATSLLALCRRSERSEGPLSVEGIVLRARDDRTDLDAWIARDAVESIVEWIASRDRVSEFERDQLRRLCRLLQAEAVALLFRDDLFRAHRRDSQRKQTPAAGPFREVDVATLRPRNSASDR